jgi:flagellum-specific ATP synthase
MMQSYVDAIRDTELVRRTGRVRRLFGLSVEAEGPHASIGEMCEIRGASGESLHAEVIGLREGCTVLMPYGKLSGLQTGCEVVATGRAPQVPVGAELLGRVLNAFGEPLDGKPAPAVRLTRPLKAVPLNPLERPRISEVLETGVRSIDTMLTLGRGQRVGVFSGSGVGKSSLLGMIARRITADVNVIALIGERGREVREFVEQHLGVEGLKRSVVVVATAEQPALARTRAAYAATAIAEYFRDSGRHVLMMMDSITRFAMARREIGLAAGEPPTARGYTPSVFAELPELCERCGTAASGGSITALYAVLVEGDDFNEPISDILRATLDGHIVLSRSLANEGHYPAIDVLQSVSRLFLDLAQRGDREIVAAALECLALHERNRQMIDIGAYTKGSNPQLDRAVDIVPALTRFLRQDVGETTTRAEAMKRLGGAMSGTTAGVVSGAGAKRPGGPA